MPARELDSSDRSRRRARARPPGRGYSVVPTFAPPLRRAAARSAAHRARSGREEGLRDRGARRPHVGIGRGEHRRGAPAPVRAVARERPAQRRRRVHRRAPRRLRSGARARPRRGGASARGAAPQHAHAGAARRAEARRARARARPLARGTRHRRRRLPRTPRGARGRAPARRRSVAAAGSERRRLRLRAGTRGPRRALELALRGGGRASRRSMTKARRNSMESAPPRPVVLIVVDAPESIDVLRSVLGSNYQVKAAINGRSALDLAEQAQPDLILLDVMMPDMDGYEVCRRLKGNPLTAKIPIIFVTTLSDAD